MKVGLFVFQSDFTLDSAVLAKKAEDAGFESFWVPEHILIPVHTTSSAFRRSAGDRYVLLLVEFACCRVHSEDQDSVVILEGRDDSVGIQVEVRQVEGGFQGMGDVGFTGLSQLAAVAFAGKDICLPNELRRFLGQVAGNPVDQVFGVVGHYHMKLTLPTMTIILGNALNPSMPQRKEFVAF